MSLACNPATSWYHFTFPFSWSNNCEVAQLLSDIPFIAAGVLAFGVSPLFLAMKRTSWSAVWLLFSAWLAFVAVVLDLGETLASGIVLSLALVSSQPALRAREILLALSLGLRFLFYWSYVAEPPRKILHTVSTQSFRTARFIALDCTNEPHSGNWARWGLPGRLVGVGILAAITTVTVLQVLWRVVPHFHQYGNIYAADAVLELLVAFLLLLKLSSNTLSFNSPDRMLVHTFAECLAPISALLINIAIGVGNLLSFAFTESTVGRLLQAVEIHIVVVFVMVLAFLKHCDNLLPTTSPRGKRCRDIAFTTLLEPVRRSTFRITPPVVETPRMSMILGAASPHRQPDSSREAFRRSVRHSLNHVTSWVSSRVSRNRMRYDDDETKLWNAEKVKVDPPYTVSSDVDTELRASTVSVPVVREPKDWTEHDVSPNRISIISALDAQSAGARSMEDAIQGSSQTLHPSQANTPQHSSPSHTRTNPIPVLLDPLSVSSGAKHSNTAVTPEASPVYGLGGRQSIASVSGPRTSLDELLRQQSQLDQSIQALRVFSARTSVSPSCSHSGATLKNMDLTRSHSIDQRTISSDVSLSSFPIPPWLKTPVPSLPSSRPPSISRAGESRRVRLATARPTLVRDTDTLVLPKASASLVDIPRSPRFDSILNSPSPSGEGISAGPGKLCCSDSEGVQYNVTSFIGGLATPASESPQNRENPWSPTENGSNVRVSQISPGIDRPPLRKLPVPPGPRPDGLPTSPAVTRWSPIAP